MAGSKVLEFFFLISLMIFSTNALKVLLTDGKPKNKFVSGFKYETGIIAHAENGKTVYDGCVINGTYTAGPSTIKVIVYIKSYQAMKLSALRQKCEGIRNEISETLCKRNYEILYLAVHGFFPANKHLIAEFLLESIQPNPDLPVASRPSFKINTIGENFLNLDYKSALHDLDIYKEEPNVYGRNLLKKLKSMD